MITDITDITDQFADLNQGDLVFRAGDGTLVKVRTTPRVMSADRVAFSITGAWADDETAKAKQFGDGHFIGRPYDVTIETDGEVDVAAVLAEARALVVARVARAAANVRAVRTLSGVKPA